MHVRKRIFAFLFAALAMLLCTACGKWDYSREAAKAANAAQGETLRVEFKVSQTFTNALRAAAEDNIQPADVDKAMTMDKSIAKLLTSGCRLDVYALRADVDADKAAAQLADEFVNRLAGCEDEGYIGMVKAENGYFYMAVLTYKHGGSGSGSGGGDDGGSGENEPYIKSVTAKMKNKDKVYFEGDSFNPGDVTVTVTMSNGETIETTLHDTGCTYEVWGAPGEEKIDLERLEELESGKYVIKNIKYNGIDCDCDDDLMFDVNSLVPVEIISVTGYEDKTYSVGDSLAEVKAGLTVTVKYQNDESGTLEPEEYTLSSQAVDEDDKFIKSGDDIVVTITCEGKIYNEFITKNIEVKVKGYSSEAYMQAAENAIDATTKKLSASFNLTRGKDESTQKELNEALQKANNANELKDSLSVLCTNSEPLEMLDNNNVSQFIMTGEYGRVGKYYCLSTFELTTSGYEVTPEGLANCITNKLTALVNTGLFLNKKGDSSYDNNYEIYASVRTDDSGEVVCAMLFVRNRTKA